VGYVRSDRSGPEGREKAEIYRETRCADTRNTALSPPKFLSKLYVTPQGKNHSPNPVPAWQVSNPEAWRTRIELYLITPKKIGIIISSQVAGGKAERHLVVLPHQVAQTSVVLGCLLGCKHRFEAGVEHGNIVASRSCACFRRLRAHIHLRIAAAIRSGLLIKVTRSIVVVVLKKLGIIFLF
jgi:hypothetical protein